MAAGMYVEKKIVCRGRITQQLGVPVMTERRQIVRDAPHSPIVGTAPKRRKRLINTLSLLSMGNG